MTHWSPICEPCVQNLADADKDSSVLQVLTAPSGQTCSVCDDAFARGYLMLVPTVTV